MRKKRSAPGCSALMRRYSCIAGDCGRKFDDLDEGGVTARVLAVDTSSPRGSLAIAGPEGVLAEARVVTSEGHSRWLLPAVSALLQGLAIEARTIDVFAVTTGPGSFT